MHDSLVVESESCCSTVTAENSNPAVQAQCWHPGAGKVLDRLTTCDNTQSVALQVGNRI